MSYKWKPSASQRRAFAEKMQDPIEKEAYEERKRNRDKKRQSTSQFDYNKAGGNYIPTKEQYDFCYNKMELFITNDEKNAANMIMYGFTCNEKIHHDFIHIINEKRRKQQSTY